MFQAATLGKELLVRARFRRALLLTIALGVSVAAITAHIHIGSLPEDSTGPLLVLDHIFNVILALGLSCLLLFVGRYIAQKFGLEFANTAEEISFSFLLGSGFVALSVLGMGLLGLLRPWPIVLLLGLYTATTVRGAYSIYEAVTKALRTATFNRESKVITALFLCLVAILLLRAATPPNTPDELIYHLPVTKQFVQQGGIYPVFDNSLGNLPFLVHMIYALCLLAGSDIAARVFSLVLAIGTGLALYGFCSRFLNRRVGVMAMFAFFAAGMVVEVAVTARIDVTLAGMLFLATYAMINYLATQQKGWLWVSAAFSGFSLGIKHSAGVWLIFVGGMYLVESIIGKHDRWITVLKRGVAYTIIAAAIASPWYTKNYLWFHNPMYPLFTGEVAEFGPDGLRYFNEDDERRLDAHFEVALKEIPAIVKAQEEELTRAINSRLPRHPMQLWTFFTKPSTYLMAEPYHYPNYLFLIIPFLLLFKKNKWILWLLALGLSYVLTVTSSSWIARYLLPAYPAFTIVAAHTLAALSDRMKSRIAFAKNLPLYAIAGTLGMIVAVCAFSVHQSNSLLFYAGAISRNEFMLPLSYYPPIDFINNRLPASTRVIIIGAQMNYGIARDYVTDESWFATKWRRLLVRHGSLEELNEDLKQQGFTHVFYSPQLFTYAATIGIKGTGGMNLIARDENKLSEEARRLGPEYQLLRNWSTFTLYRTKFLETVYSDQYDYQIFKIK